MNWLLLIYQIPAKPTYFRAKIWRRLQQVGAVPVKQAVYVMPETEQANEDLSWIAKEISDSSGEAMLLSACFLEGLTNDQVVGLFQKARRADYENVMADAKSVMALWNEVGRTDTNLLDCKASLTKLRKAFSAVVAIDFFPEGLQAKVEAFLADLEIVFRKSTVSDEQEIDAQQGVTGKTWVTQTNVYVDRMASAWFIKRFIDQKATLKFVKSGAYTPKGNEFRFDMVEAEYTHQGDLCTFEVFVKTFKNDHHGLQQVAKIIHDIDLKDDMYNLPETSGLHALFDGAVAASSDDTLRIALMSTALDNLLGFFESNKT